MRSIWKGAISFGLVNVPVKLYSATEDHDLSLHQVHDADGGRIRYQRRCEVCGKIVEYENIDKAYDDGSTTIVLTEDDLASLPEERSKSIDVSQFVPSDQLDPITFDRSYFLEPDKAAVKPYKLLRDALAESDRTAIVTFALRQKTRLAALRVRDKVIMLQTLLWDDEVREADFDVLSSSASVTKQEKKMASSLIDSLSGDFRPDAFTDEYQEQLRILIEAKKAEGEALDTAATFGVEEGEGEPGAEVIDLVEALRRSVESVGGRRTGKKAAKKTTGKKTTAKKSSAKKSSKKTAAKKSSAKKPAAKKKAS
ncbi:non-homologous end joining protein Ku [Microlunatus parietis]|uniref:Non-homologous end joining protein Ku n=1 Tax=Microlunatus parietis TaxID=682979 RepID=A0A7Y9I220_9ACTN|nr:Ku protein [Microlunatus parietis]NYE68738.1 DNA end-binding protein Ku [Microlunatus parietis]